MESSKHVVVGTAGHVDHGKSALVEALTGTNPDRLEEEQRRGITIDLGFAFLQLGGIRLDFVDVPGHERFVRNMLAGAGGIDLVVLVVAADESIKPQTREHFDICRLLGISNGLVAITKTDLVDAAALSLVRLETEEFVHGTFLEGAPINPVSARTGAGLELFKDSLLLAAMRVPPKDVTGHVRLPIDRSFAMKGFGTVVTGTLVSGSIKTSDEVELYPLRRRLRVRGIQSGGSPVQQAFAGQRTAVNLAGIEHTRIQRGMTLGPVGLFEQTRKIDARISLVPSARGLRNGATIRMHQAAMETIASVRFLDGDGVAPSGTAMAQLSLVDEALLLPGDRFILRQLSPSATIAGGVVIDAHPQRHRRKDPTVSPFLKTLERGNHEDIVMALAERSPCGLLLSEIISRTGWTDHEAIEAADALAKLGKLRVVSRGPFVLTTEQAMSKYASAQLEAVDAYHAAVPLVPGIPKQDLRARCGNPRSEVFEAALGDLVKAHALAISGDIVSRIGYAVELVPEEAHAKRAIEWEFDNAGLAAPAIADVLGKIPIDAPRAQELLQILLREKTLIKVAEDLVMHHTALARLRESLSTYRSEMGEALSIAAFKQLTGLTRKRAIPLLEYLDREHVTRRVGDERVIL